MHPETPRPALTGRKALVPKEDLQGGLLSCSAEGFAKAMDVSCHSLVRMARLAAPLMTAGRSTSTVASTSWRDGG